MSTIIAATVGGKGSRRPDASDRLRDLARRVERLGIGGRTDPEEVTVYKLTVAAELRA